MSRSELGKMYLFNPNAEVELLPNNLLRSTLQDDKSHKVTQAVNILNIKTDINQKAQYLFIDCAFFMFIMKMKVVLADSSENLFIQFNVSDCKIVSADKNFATDSRFLWIQGGWIFKLTLSSMLL
jgi:hypothetical protein